MNVTQVYSTFAGKWIKDANEYFVENGCASDFAKHVLSRRIRVLGVDGFKIGNGYTEPVLSAIADYSNGVASLDDLLGFIEEERDKVTHFSFVLEGA